MNTNHLEGVLQDHQKKLEEIKKEQEKLSQRATMVSAKIEVLQDVMRLYGNEAAAKVPKISTTKEALSGTGTVKRQPIFRPEVHRMLRAFFTQPHVETKGAKPAEIHNYAQEHGAMFGIKVTPELRGQVSSVLQIFKSHGWIKCSQVSESKNPRDRVWTKTKTFQKAYEYKHPGERNVKNE